MLAAVFNIHFVHWVHLVQVGCICELVDTHLAFSEAVRS